MQTFSHWRAAGRAMLDARRREGVTAPRTAVDNKGSDLANTRLTWMSDVAHVEARPGSNGRVSLDAYKVDYTATNFWPVRDAAEVLRVLAALDLVPADIAYAADERYGRCEVCGELAQWWPAEVEAIARWVHVKRVRFDLNPHKAEVAP